VASDDCRAPATSGTAFVRRFLHRSLINGWGAGADTGERGTIPSWLQPGDILLGANPDCAYGSWSHVSIHLGDGMVLGHHLLSGIYRAPDAEFAYYHRLRVVRPRLSPDQRAAAARWAEGLVGEVFCLFVRRDDPRRWTCAKAVWAAYAHGGLDLAPGAELLTPADLAGSAHGEVVWERGE